MSAIANGRLSARRLPQPIDTGPGFPYLSDELARRIIDAQVGGAILAPGCRWYGIQTQIGAEYLVIAELFRRGYATHCPCEVVTVRPHRGPVGERIRPYFPRYLFVQLAEVDPAWGPIGSNSHGVRGVSGFISIANSGQPTPAEPGQVERIIALAGPDGYQDDGHWRRKGLPALVKGSMASVTEAPFAGQRGVVAWSDQQRVWLMLEMFGGKRTVIVGRSGVQPIAEVVP